ncbi:hypothetical protein D3C72_1005510 [compost metagenome]
MSIWPFRPRPFLSCTTFRSPFRRAFKPKASSRTSLPTWIIRLLLIGIPAVFGCIGFSWSSSITSSEETPTALSGNSCTVMRAHGISTEPLSENNCGVASNTRSGETSMRIIGGTVTRSLSPLAAIRARQALMSRQSASPDRLSCPRVVLTSPSMVEVMPSKFITRRPSVISNGIQ